MDSLGPKIGVRIAALLKKTGMSQGQLAANVRLSQPSISSLVRGETLDPSVGLVLRIAHAFGLTIDQFLDGILPRSLEDDVRELQDMVAKLNTRVAPLLEAAAEESRRPLGTRRRQLKKGQKAK